MLKKDAMFEIIKMEARKYGFEAVANNYSTCGFNIVEKNNVVNFTIHDNMKLDYENLTETHTYEVSASIATMGGNPTPEELIDCAIVINNAAKLCMCLREYDLSWSKSYK